MTNRTKLAQWDRIVGLIGLTAAIHTDDKIILRLTAMFDIVEAVKGLKFVYLSSWDITNTGTSYQYRDTGELVSAIKKLTDLDHTCPKHPGACPPCSDGRAMDLAGAYQSILDGRM